MGYRRHCAAIDRSVLVLQFRKALHSNRVRPYSPQIKKADKVVYVDDISVRDPFSNYRRGVAYDGTVSTDAGCSRLVRG